MIKKIEELSMNAYPALSTVLVNGWVLRFAEGYSKRANSVNMPYECFNDVDENIKICEDMYRKQNLRSVFKITELPQHSEVDKKLEGMGYESMAKTNVLIKSIVEMDTNIEDDSIEVKEELSDQWLDDYIRLNSSGEKNKRILKEMFTRIIGKPYFLSLNLDGEVKGIGIGVDVNGYVGIFGIFIQDDIRRQGYGMKIMDAIMRRARSGGAGYAYLQVVDENEKAKAMYDKLGFMKEYSYWYRVKAF